MNDFTDVVSLFLNLITDFSYADYTEDELLEELGMKIKMVIAKARVIKDLDYNTVTGMLTRKVTNFEATMLAYGLIIEWVSPRINSVELFETQLSSKDFTMFSNANRLNEMRSLKRDATIEFYTMIDDYDFDAIDWNDSKWVISSCIKND